MIINQLRLEGRPAICFFGKTPPRCAASLYLLESRLLMGKTLIIAEKPSVATELARVLGKLPGMTKFEKEKDWFENETHIISSAVGHLLELSLPEAADGKKPKWNFESLPILPDHFALNPIEKSAERLAVLKKLLKREVTEDDITRLTEIKIKRISKYDSFKADEEIKNLEKDIEQTEKNLKALNKFTIKWFEELKKKYSAGRERKTEISSFDRVDGASRF